MSDEPSETPAEKPIEEPQKTVLGYGGMLNSDIVTETQVDTAYGGMQKENQ